VRPLAPELPGFLQRHFALQAGQPIEKEDALHLLDLVQRDARGKALEPGGFCRTCFVLMRDLGPKRPLDLGDEAWKRYRALLALRGLGRDGDDPRVEQQPVVALGAVATDDDDRRDLADVDSREAEGLGLLCRGQQALTRRPQRVVDAFSRRRGPAEPRVGKTDEVGQNSPPRPNRKPPLLPGTPLSLGSPPEPSSPLS
jgi:hypothetical protein